MYGVCRHCFFRDLGKVALVKKEPRQELRRKVEVWLQVCSMQRTLHILKPIASCGRLQCLLGIVCGGLPKRIRGQWGVLSTFELVRPCQAFRTRGCVQADASLSVTRWRLLSASSSTVTHRREMRPNLDAHITHTILISRSCSRQAGKLSCIAL